ncbi:MAG: DUF488 domain-containing protein [Planctomycetota bacterium]|nr:DUF488 domain-containing protein [Planctomycetota bacterium]
MQPPSPAKALTIHTLGHSNVPVEHFLGLLTQHGVQLVADVRSSPYSKFAVDYNAAPLKRVLVAAGLAYLYLGQELGGRPPEAEYYDAQGYVLYDRIAASPRFRSGLEQLLTEAARARVALLCSEESPAECHRRLLLARVLAERGVNVLHIRGDGRVQTEADVRREAVPAKDRSQQLLFEVEEAPAWKSAHSVSREDQPRNSSGS